MTDYNYNNDRVHLDSDSSAKNGAAALDGHSLQLQPRSDWPGLSADPNSQRLDPDKMLDLAEQIANCATAIQQGGVAQIQQKASVSFGPDAWQAAVYLKAASDATASLVAQYSAELVKNLQDAATAIRSAAGGYSGAEHANTQGIQNQSGDHAYSAAPTTM